MITIVKPWKKMRSRTIWIIVGIISTLIVIYYFQNKEADISRRLPKVLISGAAKCGTTALATFLRFHPQLKFTDQEEVCYFSRYKHFSKGTDWYRNLMPLSSKIGGELTVEKCPDYWEQIQALERIHGMDSDIRLLIILCNPVKQVISRYTQRKNSWLHKAEQLHNIQTKGQTWNLTFEDFAIDPSTGGVRVEWDAIQKAIFINHIRNVFYIFENSQVHIIDGDNFVHNPVFELRKVETFLGLGHVFKDDFFAYDEEKGFYCMTTDKGKHKNCLSKAKGRPHPRIDGTVMKKLKSFFWPRNEEFYGLIGRRYNWE
ncbi:unnamed protein product [Owenia fusiformis]|uniref:Uncharacterized protein n=1 Tax=Owenia fusiformis TaxID=6347 RepID=A0A8J1TN62_OWEFU|nr:unnamed protein product [Owenia fusiformis]